MDDEDIENQLVFRTTGASRGKALTQSSTGLDAKIQEEKRWREENREMTEYERQAMEQFKQNDEEIDNLLDGVI